MELWQVLVLTGGILEWIGIGAVAYDLRSTLHHVRAYERRPQNIYGAGGIASAEAFGRTTLIGGREPGTKERVRIVERRLDELTDRIEETRKELRAGIKEEVGSAVERARLEATDRHEAVEQLLRGLTVGGTRLRVIGLIALFLGVGFSVAGSLLSP